ncbi:hypothetical protein SAMN04488028_102323 [Reichenbachiella agariperforans]|uniref:Uncharacterized protein n=1 Tax=Reichenbachiella agariperforans TaxID=156994 RepID=A0A1M6NMT3_REIAG|nr:hypothetical protein SAMN04488028_102323 [Reichenbachiella agariperforans]
MNRVYDANSSNKRTDSKVFRLDLDFLMHYEGLITSFAAG